MTLGTDHPSWGQWFTPFAADREMLAFSVSGIPNAAVLRIATINSARAMGLGDRLGTIEAGKQADLVVLDVPNHRHLVYEIGRNTVRAVVKRGRVVIERRVSERA